MEVLLHRSSPDTSKMYDISGLYVTGVATRSDGAIRGEKHRDIRIRNANAAPHAVHWQIARVDESANGARRCAEELGGFSNCAKLEDRTNSRGALRGMRGAVCHVSASSTLRHFGRDNVILDIHAEFVRELAMGPRLHARIGGL